MFHPKSQDDKAAIQNQRTETSTTNIIILIIK